VELLYCHNCHFRVNGDELESGVAVQLAENKILCSKCAPLFQHSTAFFATVPLPGETQNTTHIFANGIRDDEAWSRDKLLRVLVGGAALLMAMAFVVVLFWH
jgi:hypothetical protein